MMGEIEPPCFVLCEDIRRILWLDAAEVVPTREHQDVAGEAIPSDVGDLPGLIGPELCHGSIERPSFVGATNVVAAVSADQVDRVLHRLAEFGHLAFAKSVDVETGELRGVG